MKKYIIAACLFVLVIALFSETFVPAGQVQGNWNQSGSPYRIMGNIEVANNTSLNIGAGVEVIFQGTYKLDILGQIVCSGSEDNYVIFTAQDTLLGWQSIRFSNTGETNPPSSFSYTEFNYGRAMNGSSPTDPINCGGAVYANNAGTLTFNNCKFRHCKAIGDGSAINAQNLTNIVMNNCSVKNCETEWFGAICVRNGELNITNSVFMNNYSNVFGACLYLYECPVANITSSTMMFNMAGAVAAIYSLYTPLVITNSLFARNETDTGRGGAIGVTHGTATIINCTYADNESPMDGGAIWFNVLDIPATIVNTVFWYNLPDAISTVTSTYTLSYCSMQVPQGGATNIFGNPLFNNPANFDYSLLPSSPCIDSGTPDVTGLNLPTNDLAGLPRIADGNMDSVIRIDRGCFEMPAPPAVGEISGQVTDNQNLPISGAMITVGTATAITNSWGLYSLIADQGTYTVTCTKDGYLTAIHDSVSVATGQQTIINFNLISVANDDMVSDLTATNLRCYPNPFVIDAQISFTLTKVCLTKLEIFNLKGQRVKIISYDKKAAGTYSLTWNGTDDYNVVQGSGIYLCKLTADRKIRITRLIKL